MTDRSEQAGRLAGGLLILMVAAMPFHAFFSVWLGSLTGQQTLIQAWKEVVTVIVAALTAYVVWNDPHKRTRLTHPFVLAATAFFLVAVVVTLVMRPSLVAIIYGLKTDFEFLLLGVCALVVARTATLQRAGRIAVATGVATAGIALVLALVLPRDFLSAFGYGPTTIEPFRLVDPAINTFRTPGTLGGPNQLGAFLILPLCLVVARALRRPNWWIAPAGLILAGGIWVSYSRAAVLGAVVAVALTIIVSLPWRRAVAAAGVLTVVGLVAGLLVAGNLAGSKLQYYVLHATANTVDTNNSTAIRAGALADGARTALANPLGLGLGTAGPASQRTGNAVIPENYYLQLSIETGLAGLVAFLVVLKMTGLSLWRCRARAVPLGLLGALAGLSVVCLFLHGWADSSTAFVFWILCGLALGGARHPDDREVPHDA